MGPNTFVRLATQKLACRHASALREGSILLGCRDGMDRRGSSPHPTFFQLPLITYCQLSPTLHCVLASSYGGDLNLFVLQYWQHCRPPFRQRSARGKGGTKGEIEMRKSNAGLSLQFPLLHAHPNMIIYSCQVGFKAHRSAPSAKGTPSSKSLTTTAEKSWKNASLSLA
jgi:hypothetical protein